MPIPTKSEDPLSLLRLPDVKKRVPYSRSSIYALIAAGKFPAPILLGGRAVGWLSNEIDQWIADRIAASRGSALVIAEPAKSPAKQAQEQR